MQTIKNKSRSISIFGKRISIFAVAFILMASLGTAALLHTYGTVTGTAEVDQSVVFSDDTTEKIYSWDGAVMAGNCYTDHIELKNRASIPATVALVSECEADEGNCDGIATELLKNTEYIFNKEIPVNDGTLGSLEVTVTEEEDSIVWTFDFPVENFIGSGNLNVGLIIATGNSTVPSFQIHNNDGTDSNHEWGIWLYSPWGPTESDGWNSGNTNTPTSELDWVDATGQRNTPWNGNGTMQIKIKKCKLGNVFHWAASPTVGSGFNSPASDTSMQIPESFSWASSSVVGNNYKSATIMEVVSMPLTLQPISTFGLSLVSYFDIALSPDAYTITTTVNPTV